METKVMHRIMIALSEKDAEEFLKDPKPVQERVAKDLMAISFAHFGATIETMVAEMGLPSLPTHPLLTPADLPPTEDDLKLVARGKPLQVRDPMQRGKPGPKPKALTATKKKRATKKIPCPDCKRMLPVHWIIRHRIKEHGFKPSK